MGLIIINIDAFIDKQPKANLYDYNIDDLLNSNNVYDHNDSFSELKGYEKNYSDASFWDKIGKPGYEFISPYRLSW